MREALLDWFDANARALPWRTRGPRDAFAVLVAEVVLQQTQAKRAAPAYERIIAAFPTPQALADASTADLLEHWQGLGYYQRALRLSACADALVRRHGAVVPADLAALEALPGIGRYGARAIAAQAFGRDVVAVDANVRRVGARLFALHSADDRTIERRLEASLRGEREPRASRTSVTEALIELGATVCTPRTPRCERCPLRAACQGRHAPTSYPRRTAPRARSREVLHTLVVRRGGSVALQRRPSSGRWAGLWGFPVAARADAEVGLPLDGFEHVVTHRTMEVRPRLVDVRHVPATVSWLPLHQVAAGGGDHPVAALDRRLAERLLESDARRPLRDEVAP